LDRVRRFDEATCRDHLSVRAGYPAVFEELDTWFEDMDDALPEYPGPEAWAE